MILPFANLHINLRWYLACFITNAASPGEVEHNVGYKSMGRSTLINTGVPSKS